jgi:hypothetical protein
MYACEDKYTQQGECKLFTSPEIATIATTKKKLVTMASAFMDDFDAITKQSNLSPLEIVKIRGDFEVRLVMYVHGKSKAFDSLADIAWSFWGEVKGSVGAGVCPKAWGAPPTDRYVVPNSASMREADVSGVADIAGELMRKGFKPLAKIKSATASAIIKSIDKNNNVTLTYENDKTATVTGAVALQQFKFVAAEVKQSQDQLV